ncbi:CobW family GTP-binding protein [Nitratireductor luteus]|uniref:CobW family GTP-binding protein n=1 Tax=Nitratireductor luteus TaxID=2976980 RepID=UPI002240D21F|nr:GTP-binding protein [Nitratireductor luteus]
MTPVPCAVVTGALGSGKTTAIRELLARPEMEGTALIINEFGEVGLDHLLVSSAVETTLLMENGCMCCSLRGDVVDTVLLILAAAERGDIPTFRRIMIETTGLADPIPIVRELSNAHALRDKIRLAKVATCVDGVIGRAELAQNPVAIHQVAQADLVLVTKTDLADPLMIDELCEALFDINPMLAIHPVREGGLPDGDFLFGDPSDSEFVAPEIRAHSGHTTHHHHAGGGTALHTGVESWSRVIGHPLQWARLRDWLDLVYSLNAARVLRSKGILWIEESDRPLLVQGVGPVITPPRFLEAWPQMQRESRIVMILKDTASATIGASFNEYVLKSDE